MDVASGMVGRGTADCKKVNTSSDRLLAVLDDDVAVTVGGDETDASAGALVDGPVELPTVWVSGAGLAGVSLAGLASVDDTGAAATPGGLADVFGVGLSVLSLLEAAGGEPSGAEAAVLAAATDDGATRG